MKLSDVIINIMKIMWWGLKKIPSSRFRDIQKGAKIKIYNKVALRQVVRKQSGASKYDVKQPSNAT